MIRLLTIALGLSSLLALAPAARAESVSVEVVGPDDTVRFVLPLMSGRCATTESRRGPSLDELGLCHSDKDDTLSFTLTRNRPTARESAHMKVSVQVRMAQGRRVLVSRSQTPLGTVDLFATRSEDEPRK